MSKLDKNKFEKYRQSINYLESLFNLPQPDYLSTKSSRTLFLKRFSYFLNILGNPQIGPQYIHIGGTSGKGSTANMIHSILTEAGKRTGLYTSPFPTTTIEKIKFRDLLISPDEFAGLMEKIKPAVDETYQKSPFGRPSYYEICTAIAFLYFKQKKCDYVVLEVGLGGRYDATNIIPAAKITVINLIDFDHTNLLGKTLREIAKEKAGIIKPKTTFFTIDENNGQVLKYLQTICRAKKAEFNLVSPQKKYPINLLGDHQQKNAALADAVGAKLGIKPSIINAGLQKTRLSCRMEMIQTNPKVILDGAHNRSKIKTTIETLKNLTYKKLYLIISLTNERDASQVFKELFPLADYILATRYQSVMKKCRPPLQLVKNVKTNNYKIFLDPKMALKEALRRAGSNDLILVTGSFYLAGEIRKQWRDEEKILKERKI